MITDIFFLLDNLHLSTIGFDELPAWYLRLTAPVFSFILSHLINQSLAQLPMETSLIHPIPKIPNPSSPSDYRPISITSTSFGFLNDSLSETSFISVVPLDSKLSNQFAFHPTGSTTAAIVAILHHASYLLLANPYVSHISLDFSKAFDSVRHSTFISKFSALDQF